MLVVVIDPKLSTVQASGGGDRDRRRGPWGDDVVRPIADLLEGFERALERKQRASPPVPKLLDGEQEAQVIALRTGPPPKGYANWSLRLLARRVVELALVESISHETVRRTLKKTG